MHLRRNITYECLLSQPVSALSSFKSSQSVMVCFKENLLWWRNNISGLKDFCACFYHAPKILSRGTKHPGWKRLATLNWKWKGSFQVYTQFRSWFLKKSITICTFLKCGARMHTKNYIAKFPFFSAIKLPPCELVVFTDLIWTCITEDRNFKIFLKENYTITLHSSYLFTKKMLKMEFNLLLIVFMEFANIRHSWNLQQIWWVPWNLSKLWIW